MPPKKTAFNVKVKSRGLIGEVGQQQHDRRTVLEHELHQLIDQQGIFEQVINSFYANRSNEAPTSRPQVDIQTFTSSLGTCGICLGEYSNTHEPVIVDKCRHVFGRECLRKHVEESVLRGRHLCPTCRTAMFVDPHLVPRHT
ncbi:hypothetical protein BU16DRAFT_536153 [Lophium mytilinum]|uniref:RING-type domain-containing protein n=1 Tax=Lophium mytilinum TaxID=390894 RepID=A0A6A6R5N4_9PEZI|nr:hypothetical protein BU16DRAFT_536153 [Lophium mytilinum]